MIGIVIESTVEIHTHDCMNMVQALSKLLGNWMKSKSGKENTQQKMHYHTNKCMINFATLCQSSVIMIKILNQEIKVL